MPFGGGKAVIAEFTDLRWITIEGPQHYPFWKARGRYGDIILCEMFFATV
jgi:hypothetical protein